MSLRVRIFIIVSVAILVITGVIILVIQSAGRKKTPSAPTSTASNVTVIDSSNFDTKPLTPVTPPPTINTTTKITADPSEATRGSVRQFAKVFVERYGTYSSDATFQNVRDVETMVTKNLLAYLTKTVSSTTPKNQPFIGVTTKVVTAEIGEWSDTAATVKVQVTRIEERGTQPLATTQQSGTVKLVKQGEWLVDGIYWDK